MTDTNLRCRYTLYLCPECGEMSQYAGFCDNYEAHPSLQPRLGAYSCVPVEKVLQTRDELANPQSPVASFIIDTFVERLIQ
jgi:hypothetical protein